MHNAQESKDLLIKGMQYQVNSVGVAGLRAGIAEILRAWNAPEYFYEPSSQLKKRLEEYKNWCTTNIGEDPGKLMEEIALLAMKCLQGYENVKSYQSYAAQIDLLISGSSENWCLLMEYLHLDNRYRSIVVEAKNLNKKVDDKQFSRFCYHLQNTFVNTSQLGLFFTRYGATGFPERGKGTIRTRQRSIKDAQATQIIFHARHNKFVIVLDHEDIIQLDQAGMLPKIIEAKIRETEQWSGLNLDITEELAVVDLPEHLRKHMINS